MFNVGDAPTEETVNKCVQQFTETVLSLVRKHVPVKKSSGARSTHPWLNERCLALVAAKHRAEGTPEYERCLRECSEGLLQEYKNYVQKTREKLRELPRSSKKWWNLSQALAHKTKAKTGIPPLKREDGSWARQPTEKAKLLLDTFTAKNKLPNEVENAHSTLAPESGCSVSGFLPVRARTATQVLKKLKEDKATGPDKLAAKVLKRCAKALGRPVAKLTRLLLQTGHWPSLWKVHWVHPLYKKKSVYDANNYRGIHLSAQLSKVVERLVGKFLLPFLESTGAYEENQFAYRKERGCKDALALNVLQWVWWLAHNQKVGLYCSDVFEAFDKVSTARLLAKLERRGVQGQLLNF